MGKINIPNVFNCFTNWKSIIIFKFHFIFFPFSLSSSLSSSFSSTLSNFKGVLNCVIGSLFNSIFSSFTSFISGIALVINTGFFFLY